MKQCQSAFDPSKDNNMCAKFALESKNRFGPTKSCGDNVAPRFITMKNVCLPDGNPVPNLADGYMTPDAANFACSLHRNETANDCKGFWYYPPTDEPASLTSADEPILKCGEDLPWYGEKLIHDPKCADPTCTDDCQLGCIGKDNPTCSRCIYNMVSCRSTLGEAECEKLQKGSEIRGSASCTAPAPQSNEVYVRFSTVWDPVDASTGKCDPPQGKLGASLGALRTPEARFNPATVERSSGFLAPVTPIQINAKGQTQFASAKVAFNLCWQHAQDHPEAPCMGFNYSHQNVDPLLRGPQADFTFMTGRLNPVGNSEQATYMATWVAPKPKLKIFKQVIVV